MHVSDADPYMGTAAPAESQTDEPQPRLQISDHLMAEMLQVKEELVAEERAAEQLPNAFASDTDAESASGDYNRVATDDPYR